MQRLDQGSPPALGPTLLRRSSRCSLSSSMWLESFGLFAYCGFLVFFCFFWVVFGWEMIGIFWIFFLFFCNFLFVFLFFVLVNFGNFGNFGTVFFCFFLVVFGWEMVGIFWIFFLAFAWSFWPFLGQN